MSITMTKGLRIRAGAMKQSADSFAKSQHGQVTVGTALEYNKLLKEIQQHIPSLKPHLPREINASGEFAMMGLSQANALELSANLAIVVGLLENVEE